MASEAVICVFCQRPLTFLDDWTDVAVGGTLHLAHVACAQRASVEDVEQLTREEADDAVLVKRPDALSRSRHRCGEMILPGKEADDAEAE